MSKTLTTRHQYARMLEFLQENPQMAQGFTKCQKEEVTKLWENVAEALNSLGPPTKETACWKKVWLDWKSYVKRKLAENKKEQAATGGGRYRQHTFNEMEEQVIHLAGLQINTFGITNTVCAGLPSQGEETLDAVVDVSMVSTSSSAPQVIGTPTPKKRAESNAVDMLKEQIEMQKNFNASSVKHFDENKKKIEEVASGVRRLCRVTEKLVEVQKEELEEMRRHNRAIEKLLAEKSN